MIDRLRALAARRAASSEAEDEEPSATAFPPLRVLTAEMLLVTGVDAAVRAFRRPSAPFAAALAPALLAPLAAAAHLTHGARPTARTATASALLDAAVIGAGIAALADALRPGRDRSSTFSLTPLALASAGLLGRILDREERLDRAEHLRLERRASVVQRLVPARRAKLDRIVVHV